MMSMKTDIHPEYVEAHVRCTCGNEFTTRSTQNEIHVEICSNCHPFYTGRQKLVDTGGRAERFPPPPARPAAHAAGAFLQGVPPQLARAHTVRTSDAPAPVHSLRRTTLPAPA